MCGFPLGHLDRHLQTLVGRERRSVAICEEFARRSSNGGGGGSASGKGASGTSGDGSAIGGGKWNGGVGKGLFERRVTRVLTPGTLIDESFLNPYENNYLLAISTTRTSTVTTSSPSSSALPNRLDNGEALGKEKARGGEEVKCEEVEGGGAGTGEVGLAWIDVSTGEFFAKVVGVDMVKDYLVRIAPKEVVLALAKGKAGVVCPGVQVANDGKGVDVKVKDALMEEECFVSYFDTSKTDTMAKAVRGMEDGVEGGGGEGSLENLGGKDRDITPSDDLLALQDQVPSASPPQTTTILTSSSHPSTPRTISTAPSLESSAISLLTTYLQANLLEYMPRTLSPSRESESDSSSISTSDSKSEFISGWAESSSKRMQIDANTIKALEIRENNNVTAKGGLSRSGTLMSIVKRTVTGSGTRLLSRWLCACFLYIIFSVLLGRGRLISATMLYN